MSRPRGALVAVVVLALAALAGERVLCARLERAGALERDDVLFNADPQTRLLGISHNWLRNVHLTHPLFGPLFATPIRAAAVAAERLGVTAAEPEEVRNELGLWVAPLVGAAKLACLFGVALAIGLSTLEALLLAAVAGLSFSQLLFGALPETFGPASLGLAALHLLLARSLRLRRAPRLLPWLAVGAYTAGITVTNAAAVTLLYFVGACAAGRRPPVAAAASGAVGALALALGVGLGFAADLVYGHDFDLAYEIEHRREQSGGYAEAGPRALPGALVQTFAPPEPVLVTVRDPNDPTASLQGIRFPAEVPGASAWVGWLCVALVAAGTARALTGLVALRRARAGADGGALPAAGGDAADDERRAAALVGVGCVLVLGFNAVLHAAWGAEPFLYSAHWQPSAAVLVGVALTGTRLAPLLAVLVLLLATHNLAILRTVEQLL